LHKGWQGMGPVVLKTDKDLSNKFIGQVESMFIIYPNQLKYIYFFNELLDFINRHSFKSPNGIGETLEEMPALFI
jgi:hypothetical protein